MSRISNAVAKPAPRRVVQKSKATRVRPAPGRMWRPAVSNGRGLDAIERQDFLNALLSSRSFDEACLVAGVARGDALLTRGKDRRFATAWDRVMETRIAEVDVRLTDLALAGLERGVATGEDAKSAIALGQWLVEGKHMASRKGSTQAKASAAKSAAKAADKPAAERQPAVSQQQVDAMFEEIERRLRAAEALSR